MSSSPPPPAAAATDSPQTNNEKTQTHTQHAARRTRTPLTPPPVSDEILTGSSPPASVSPFLKSVLRSSAFLNGLKDDELHVSGRDLSDLVSRARAVRFHAGDVLIEQGSKSHFGGGSQPLYILQGGPSGVYITKKHANGGQPVRVGTVKEGEMIGDMALYADTPPSVSIKSEGEVLAWQIDKAAFDQWIASRPAVKHSLDQRTWLWSALSKNYLFRGLDDDLQKVQPLKSTPCAHHHALITRTCL